VWHRCQRQGRQHGPQLLHLEVLMTIFRRHLRRQVYLPGGCTYHRHRQPPHGHLRKRPGCMPCGMGVPCGTARHRRGKAMLKNSGCAQWFQNGLLKTSGPNRPRRRPWSRLGSRLLGLRQLGPQNSRPSQPASRPPRPRLLGLHQLGLQNSRASQPASRPPRPPSNPQHWLVW
jgi:hypothetical protein